MITDKELVYISVLIKLKMKTLGDSEQDKWKKHNYRIIKNFLYQIRESNIQNYIKDLKDELKEKGVFIEK